MEFGRTNMAIISLYSILGSVMNRKIEYTVGRNSNIASLSLYSILDAQKIARSIEYSDKIAIFR